MRADLRLAVWHRQANLQRMGHWLFVFTGSHSGGRFNLLEPVTSRLAKLRRGEKLDLETGEIASYDCPNHSRTLLSTTAREPLDREG